jgi:Bifunctional DNA primase/polymerase, N-terminal
MRRLGNGATEACSLGNSRHRWPTRRVLAKQTQGMDHLAHALRYAERGFPVFPLSPRSKLPLVPAERGGHGLHDATTDPAAILLWWEAHPNSEHRHQDGRELRRHRPRRGGSRRCDGTSASRQGEATRARSENGQPVSLSRQVDGNRQFAQGSCLVSTSEAKADMSSRHLLSIRMATDTAGSTRILATSLRLLLGCWSS